MLAAAVALRTPWPVVAVLALGLFEPSLALMVTFAFLAVAVIRRGRNDGTDPADEAVFHAAVAAELRAGGSLRMALVNAAGRVPGLGLDRAVRHLGVGAPLWSVASDMSRQLPVSAPLLRPAVAVAASAGGSAATVFDALAGRARTELEAQRELRAATAQARLSAWVVGGMPVVAVGYGIATGRIQALIRTGSIGVVVMTVGLALLLVGLAAVVVLVRRGAR